MKVKKLLI